MTEAIIKLESKTLKPEQLKVIEDEMNAFLELSPKLKAAIERLNQDAAYCFIAGKPAPKC